MAQRQSDGSIILSTKVDSSGISKGLASIAKTAGKAFMAVGATALATTVAITKEAVNAFAEYEQLVGGVETLFKNSAPKVMKYAQEAYRTAGLSANEYMQNVTTFSASLISSVGGDTEKAADIANAALIAISDNVNKMGSTYESVQLAFQGFAKGQYQLLDNLKLGYGGTRGEMERLLRDAEAITGVKYDINNLADVYTAVGVIQDKLGITGTTAKEAATTINGSAMMMKASWENVLIAISSGEGIDAAINNLVESITIYFRNIIPVVERSLQGIGTLIAQVAPMLVQTVVQELIKATPQLVVAAYQIILGLAKGIIEGIKALFAGKVVEVVAEQTKAIDLTASSQNKVTEAVKETNKELKKSLAGFDEIQTLSSGTADSASADGGPVFAPDVEGASYGGGAFAGIAASIKTTLSDILSAAYPALLAVGLLVLFSGNILGGIGLIVAGAAAYMVSDTLSSDNPVDTLMGHLSKLKEIVVPALLGLGVLLLFLGQIPLGIGLILGGIVAYGLTEISTEEYDTASFQDKLNVIIEAVSLAIAVIGVLLIFLGHIPLGIGMIIGGKELFEVTEEKIEEGGATSKVKKFLEDNQALIVGVSLAILVLALILIASGTINQFTLGMLMLGATGLAVADATSEGNMGDMINKFIQDHGGWIAAASIALLVIGIILCVAGVGMALGISLIAAGAVGLVTVIALNWDSIVTNIKNFLFENSALIALISGGLLILGIILCVTGVGLPLGIALIAAGAIGLVTVTALSWDSIVEWISGAWDAVKGFWDKYIAPIFTLDFWLDLAKSCGNGLIAGFEGAINGIIGLFETMINWVVDGLNKISFEVPDWVPMIGGSTFGFNIPRVQFGRVSIPRLATGAVIPPNKEFLAVLGDQKQGVNIETPLTTMIEAFNIALDSRGGNEHTETILEIDGEKFGRLIYRLNKQQSRRVGVNFSEV